MPTFIRKPQRVEAFQYLKGQPRTSWPKWAQVYQGRDALGAFAPMGVNGINVLVIPINGAALNASSGDYIVLDGALDKLEDDTPIVRGNVLVVKEADFLTAYEATEETGA